MAIELELRSAELFEKLQTERYGPTLEQLIQFCLDHPHLRFWQAVYAWTESGKILIDGLDPFSWEGRARSV